MSSQDLLNVIGVTATFSLGLVAIVLACFAIWLSRRFDERSGAALEAIRDLARETRALIDVSVSQQRDFSSKMLDSILARDSYGRLEEGGHLESDALEAVVRKELAGTEQRIGQAIEDTIRRLPPQPDAKRLEQAVASVRRDVRKLADAAAARVSAAVELPEPLREAFDA